MSIDWTIIRRSIEDQLTESETAALEQWLGESESRRAFYRDVCMSYSRQTGFDLSDERFREYKHDFETRLGIRLARRARMRRRRLWMRVAAAVVLPLLLCGGALWTASRIGWLQGQEPIRPGVVKAIVYNMDDGQHSVFTIEDADLPPRGRSDGGSRTAAAARQADPEPADGSITRRVVIPRGAEYPLQMQDGTTVWLNSSSELVYTVDPEASERRVELTGEAYFDVSRDPERPFVVVAGDVEVRVYGTSFNVNTRAGNFIQTIVEEGSVSVHAGGEPEKMLEPGQMGQFDRATGKVEIHNVNVAHYLSWKSGIYIFENKPVEEILTELSMWYDVDVAYPNDKARMQRFSGSLPRNRELSELLELMEKTTRVHFEIEGRTVVVK